MARLAMLALATLAAACGPARRPLPYSPAEHLAAESKALSQLAALEAALERYKADHGRPPAALRELAPRYLSEIPPLDLGAGHHPPGAKPRPGDTGGWGYSPTEGRVFIDCSHLNSRERPWNQELGVL